MSAATQSRAITHTDAYLFAQGTWYKSYEKLGAHQQGTGYHFAVWAPGVAQVAVVGQFNQWVARSQDYLILHQESGIWEGTIDGIAPYTAYKYLITTSSGEELYKADPYAAYAEVPPATASMTVPSELYSWGDARWMRSRRSTKHLKKPLNIYEVHLGSWKRHRNGLPPDEVLAHPDADTNTPDIRPQYLSYTELAQELVSYVVSMGYTHLELMPIMEHPFDGSWGYQITGYYAPTSRYGTPDECRALIDAAHQAGIGVILDWVPGGFCRDHHGLVAFTGEQLYEKQEHPNWGTFQFDMAKPQVRSFLVSNVLYWLEEFHVDGIRVDGVTSMLYLNFGVSDASQKQFNELGTEEDLDAIAFLRQCNEVVGKLHPDVMMIAEESTAWPLVTYPPHAGGLGFHYKWDMGWMNDTLHYCQTDFPWRPGNHRLLTFSTMYQHNENFILPLSHDEVVHGKCSLITRMPGDIWRQFAGLRALALYQMTHVGAKLNFMGNEIGQFIEWRYYEGIEFFLTEQFSTHAAHQRYCAALNTLYKNQPGLWDAGYTPQSFKWIDADNEQQSIISFLRHGRRVKDDLIVLINFDVAAREGFRLGVPRRGVYREIFNSDHTEFGGSGVCNEDDLITSDIPWNGQPYSVVVRVPPLGGLVLNRVSARVPLARQHTT